MSTKTFKSVVSEGRLSIADNPNRRITVGIRREGTAIDMVDLAPSDAPALALAVLEAAGCRSYVGSGDDLGLAVENLDKHIAWVETQAAEAEAQAELEAEALELHQLFESLQSDDETIWLAVARRAREMRAEK